MVAGVLLAASLTLSASARSDIDAAVMQVMRDDHVPGLSLGVARNGHTLYTRGYGLRDIAHALAAGARTIYRIGSITKQFTAALVLQETERGALPLDAAVDGVTIAQLLSQTTGIPSYTDPGQTLESALNAGPAFTPGSRWQYSNSNYYLLGMALQSVTRKSYADLLSERIVQPLGLTSTTFILPTGTDVATGYRWDDTQYLAAPTSDRDTPALAFSAAALSSNVLDLMRWLFELQNGAVVSPESFDRMTSSGTLRDGTPTHYGSGFFIDTWSGWRIAEHTGFIDGFSSIDLLSLDDGVELAILTNTDQESLVPLAKTIFSIVDAPKVPESYHAAENEDPAISAQVKLLVIQLAQGSIDRTMLTTSYASSLNAADLQAFSSQLRPLGALRMEEFIDVTRTGTEQLDTYRLSFEEGQLLMTITYRNGKIDAMKLGPAR